MTTGTPSSRTCAPRKVRPSGISTDHVLYGSHTGGWHSLDEPEGSRATGGAVVVVCHEEILGPDPDDWPEELFEGDGELLHEDVFPGQVVDASAARRHRRRGHGRT